MALNLEKFIEINDPKGSGTGMPSSGRTTFKDKPESHTGASILQELVNQGLVEGFAPDTPGSGSGTGAANARNARDTALKQLDIQRRRLEFQQRTGLRDSEQARTKGLRGAINNALQRGIFKSGIREFNEAEVNREADEASADLKQDIAFSLESLKVQREGLEAQKFGGGSGSGSGAGGLDLISAAQAKEDSPELARALNAQIREQNENARKLQELNVNEGAPIGTGSGVVTPVQPRGTGVLRS